MRAQVLLTCDDGASDAAVAEAYGIDRTTVRRWRLRYHAEGTAFVTEGTAAGQDRALLIPLTDAPPTGMVWTTRSVAAETELSQSTVARIWRAAGFHPPETDALLLDPWFRGRARVLAGLYISGPVAPHQARQALAQGGLGAALFCVYPEDATATTGTAEDRILGACTDRDALWDAAVGARHAIAALAERLPSQTAAVVSSSLRATIEEVRAGLPTGTALWVILNQSPSSQDRARLLELGVHLRSTPSTVSWNALLLRSLSATHAFLAAAGVPRPVDRITSALRRQAHSPSASGHATWTEHPTKLDEALQQLHRSLHRRPARQPTVVLREPGAALVALHTRYQDLVRADLPAFEQVTAVRRKATDRRPTAQNCMDALVVLAERHQARDLAEAALVTYARQPWVALGPWDIAHYLGLTTLHGVGQRQRRLRRTAARGGHSAFSSATPAPREAVRFDQDGRRRNLVLERIRESLARWHEDLVDHEHLRERLPTEDDVFALLTYIVDPQRPVLAGQDDEPGPRERRQADASVGLMLVTDLVHQLNREVLAWHDLADTAGVPYPSRGAPFGQSASAAQKARHRLHNRYAEAPEDRHATSASTRRDARDLVPRIRQALDQLETFRDHLADDEDLTDWLDLLAGPEPALTFFLQLTAELRTERDCGACGRRRAPGIRGEDGEIRCAHCANCPGLATLTAECAALVNEAQSPIREAEISL
ncbi:helix-turn-helix domain-containing protein [Amycolatopsis magusensis]|uniref:helix-turn-helix domain-containing protein n=1 Tax=Amycolatopsis magusensis TaxID=882444 RepID=UPI0037B6D106